MRTKLNRKFIINTWVEAPRLRTSCTPGTSTCLLQVLRSFCMGTGKQFFYRVGRGSQLSSVPLRKLVDKFDLCRHDSGLHRSYFIVCLHYGGTHLGITWDIRRVWHQRQNVFLYVGCLAVAHPHFISAWLWSVAFPVRPTNTQRAHGLEWLGTWALEADLPGDLLWPCHHELCDFFPFWACFSSPIKWR